MAPKKLINKSRPVSQRRGKSPKNPKNQEPESTTSTILDDDSIGNSIDSTPSEPISSSARTAQIFPLSNLFKTPQSPSFPVPTLSGARSILASQPYTGLEQVGNNLTFPKFDPNNYFASDLFSDSSSLQRTTKAKADEMLQSIEEKRHTVAVANANIKLNQDVVRAGNEYQKLEGMAIDYATTGVNNATKFITYQTAQENQQIADVNYQQANERLTQGRAVLSGMSAITPLIVLEWQERKALKESQVASLRIASTQAREGINPRLLREIEFEEIA
jgi:hypothetical protein